MKITEFRIRNLFGIKEFLNKGKSIEITGDNGTGKTSIIDSFVLAVTNKSKRESVIKSGEKEGEVFLSTDTGIKIDRKFRTDKADYKSIKEGDNKNQSTEAFLRTFFTPMQLDPIGFAKMETKEQNRIILDLIDFKWDMNWIKKQFGEIPPEITWEQNILKVLHDIQKDESYYFVTRQDINREIRNKDAIISDIGKDLPDDYNADKWKNEILGDKFKVIERLHHENKQIEVAKEVIKNRDNKVRGFQADLDISTNAIEKETTGLRGFAREEIERSKNIIKEQEKILEELEESKIKKIELEQVKYERNIAEFDAEVKQYEEYAGKELKDVSELQEEVDHIEKMKNFINEYNRMKDYQNEVEHLQSRSEKLTEKIEHARALPGIILEDCNIPIKGLTIKDCEPLINGRSISNLSEGEKFDLCVDVALQNQGSLNMILLDGVERWSEKNRKINYKKLQDAGVIFIATRTTDSDALKITELN